MSKVSEAIRNHHRELMGSMVEQVTAFVEGRSHADPQAIVAFLQEELLPHAKGEEAHLYAAVEPLVKAHERATATMSIDHEFIEKYIQRVAEAVRTLQEADAKDRPRAEEQLRHLLLQLEAVLRVHLEKEERVYLPLFERYLSEEEQQRVLDGMHAAYE